MASNDHDLTWRDPAWPDLRWTDRLDAVDWDDLSALYREAPLADKPPALLRQVFGASRWVCFVHDAQGRLAGAGRVLADGADAAYLADVAVRPAHQGRGLGDALLRRLVAQAAGHRKLLLYAVPGKEAFYERFGFRRMRTAMAIFPDPAAAAARGYIDAQPLCLAPRAGGTAAAPNESGAAPGEASIPAPAHSSGGTTVRRLAPDDAPAYRALMLAAYAQHPDAFTSSADERAALPLAWWQQRLAEDADGGDAAADRVFGVFADGVLAGAAGLSLEQRAKVRHKATLFGMVVQPTCRRAGLGRALVEAVLAHARSLAQLEQVQLTVTEGNVAAQRLYEACGFVAWGVEPRAVRLNPSTGTGTGAGAGAGAPDFVAKVHMTHRLRP